MRARRLFPALLAAAAFALAGCGGDDNDANNGGSGSGESSENPAETILADAGLQVCGEVEDQLVQSIGEEGAQNVRAFAVAKDCGGSKTSPDTITIVQFDSLDSRDRTAAEIGTAHPRTNVMTSGALLIVSAGPNREANADAVGQAYTDSTGEPVTTV
ncbi:MAG TPA: hypothetical protein VKA45_15700 [Gaiellaceae bacterium]|nr:hypothetical protein [Gaiellaceae bacterium]